MRALTDTGYEGELPTNSCFLTKEIEKYLIGRNKLTIFGYMNEKIVTDIHWRETKRLLQLMDSFYNMPVRMLPNPSAKEILDKKNLKVINYFFYKIKDIQLIR